jgi:hypothetical protein
MTATRVPPQAAKDAKEPEGALTDYLQAEEGLRTWWEDSEMPDSVGSALYYPGGVRENESRVPYVTQPPQPVRVPLPRAHYFTRSPLKPGRESEILNPAMSPRHRHVFCAPTNDGIMPESDFDRASKLANFPQLAAPLAGGTILSTLDIDVEGRVEDFASVLRENANCLLLKLASGICTLNAACDIFCKLTSPNKPGIVQRLYLCPGETIADESTGCCFDGSVTALVAEQIREQARAHHLTLREGCIVYTRDAHEATVLKNWTTTDQCERLSRCSRTANRPTCPCLSHTLRACLSLFF